MSVDCTVCGQECASERGMKIHRTRKHSDDWGTEEVECRTCDKSFEIPPYRYEGGREYSCSRECCHEWWSETHQGESRPNWRGGGNARDAIPIPDELRQRILERDDYQCQNCGLENNQHKEKWGHGLHIHHKTPRRWFTETYDSIEVAREKANQEMNLVSLCNSCHQKSEGTYLQ